MTRPGAASRPNAVRIAGALAWLATLLPDLARADDNPRPSALPPGATSQVTALSSVELWLAFAILAFGLVVLLLQFVLLRRAASLRPEDILRLFSVTTIVIGTLAVIALGYSKDQISAALGLFGTILGYLLGRTDESIRARRQDKDGGNEADTGGKPPGT
jgi:hypothetical protein